MVFQDVLSQIRNEEAQNTLPLKYIIATDEHITLWSTTSMSNYSAARWDSMVMNMMLQQRNGLERWVAKRGYCLEWQKENTLAKAHTHYVQPPLLNPKKESASVDVNPLKWKGMPTCMPSCNVSMVVTTGPISRSLHIWIKEWHMGIWIFRTIQQWFDGCEHHTTNGEQPRMTSC